MSSTDHALDRTLDAARVRAAFPSLASGVTRFDGPGGSQTPAVVAEAVAAAMTSGLGQRGTATDIERLTDGVVLDARSAMADLLGADPGAIVFGRSMTQLTMDLARTLGRTWGPGDEVVVTRLDHDSNITPWVLAAERAGATLRRLDFDPVTGELDDIATVLSERTRLVAVTAASNLIGTRPDIPAIAAAAHRVGALVFVDAVHLTPHAPVDLTALGADLMACSPYKFFGPHLGVLTGTPDLLESLHPDKLAPSSNAVPERFELGTLPYELLAGTTAAVDFIADLASSGGSRRERVTASMTALEGHEEVLSERLRSGLLAIEGVTLHARPARRTPTTLFSVRDRTGREVHHHLAGLDIYCPAGNFYALEASRRLGLGSDGALRAGLAAYTSDDDVDRLLTGVAGLI